MITPVINYFNSITTLPRELVDDIIKYTRIREYKKEEFILKGGKISNHTSWMVCSILTFVNNNIISLLFL
jgi:hypothetical protein